VTGTIGPLRLTAVVDRAPAFAVGDKVHFVLPPKPSALFAETGERLS
jgi:iron(III) transport system ATP-binding protein